VESDNFFEDDVDQLNYTNIDMSSCIRKINVTKRDFSIYELWRRYKKGKLDLAPTFQRREVWKPIQQSELIIILHPAAGTSQAITVALIKKQYLG